MISMLLYYLISLLIYCLLNVPPEVQSIIQPDNGTNLADPQGQDNETLQDLLTNPNATENAAAGNGTVPGIPKNKGTKKAIVVVVALGIVVASIFSIAKGWRRRKKAKMNHFTNLNSPWSEHPILETPTAAYQSFPMPAPKNRTSISGASNDGNSAPTTPGRENAAPGTTAEAAVDHQQTVPDVAYQMGR